jgi:L-alanine-DL-glutamate epimerase-like enolase superfamily enzyme
VKITHIETYPVRIPLKPQRRMISALGRHTESDYLLVRVVIDSGIEGAGEATVMPRWSGETVWGAQFVVDQIFAPLLIGCDPREMAEIERRMDASCAHNWFAKSAIEMACWDICGRAAGKPVYELLGGARRSLTIRSRFSMGAYEPEIASTRARELVAAGFTTIKVKVGGDPQQDVTRVRTVREAAGPDVALVIDANCGWDVETAIRAIHELEDCRLALVEQPTPDGDYAALARVRRETTPPVMADDICFNIAHARELVRNACCDVISVYPGKNAGIGKSRAIAELAAQAGLSATIGSNLEWDVATAAMAHLVVGTPAINVETYPGDMLGPSYHEFSIVKNPLVVAGPLTTLTDRPGLGVDVDWEAARKNRCPSPSPGGRGSG